MPCAQEMEEARVELTNSENTKVELVSRKAAEERRAATEKEEKVQEDKWEDCEDWPEAKLKEAQAYARRQAQMKDDRHLPVSIAVPDDEADWGGVFAVVGKKYRHQQAWADELVEKNDLNPQDRSSISSFF